MITSIETIRSVARHAVEDPTTASSDSPPACSLSGLLPRLAQLVTGLFAAGAPGGNTIHVVAQALAAFLPLLDLGRQPAEPPAPSELVTKDEARIDLLRQERTARARLRSATARHRPAQRVRPDRPPFAAFTAPPDEEVWHDLLDLTSEALEAFIRFRHPEGVGPCLELLELLAETFGVDVPEAA